MLLRFFHHPQHFSITKQTYSQREAGRWLMTHEVELCNSFRHLPDTMPIEGRTATINFIFISLQPSDGHLTINRKSRKNSKYQIIKNYPTKNQNHDWPRLHLRCDRLNVQNSTESFCSSENGENRAQPTQRWTDIKLMNEMWMKEIVK